MVSQNKPQQLLADYLLSQQEQYYRLAYSYVKNKDDALDILHDSICKAMVTKRKPQKEDEIKPWFYRIVINTALDFLRKRKLLVSADEGTLVLYTAVDDTCPDLDLHHALESLSPDYRNIIVLRYFEDLKIEDIATVLDENVNTIFSSQKAASAVGRLSMRR